MKKIFLNKNDRYDSINGLRTLSCIGIALMHIKANIKYSINGFWPNLVISEFTNFVFLFMIISSFGMCCGYFQKIKNNEISPEKFYSKRFYKIMPFFFLLLILDVIIEHNIPALVEAFANSTLMFGFLQKDIEVLGVAWFLGLVFIFYFIFPFFTYLFGNKKRAWISTLIAILMNFSCVYYFNIGRTNMFYSFIYFCVGGLVYLYKNEIINLFKRSKIIGLLLISFSLILYFIFPMKNEYVFLIRMILVSVSLIIYSISYESKILNNGITKFIGGISLEIYLCHMVVFRIVEKLNLTHVFSNNWISYTFTCVLVLIGAICIATVFKYAWKFVEKKVFKNENSIGK